MKLDWLTDPLSPDAPCGPNLEAEDDAAFIDYYYEAESRMPERYFTPGIGSDNDEFTPGVLFDRTSIEIKDERKSIEALLKRSRDLRLLSLLARFEILSGSLEGFRDALVGMANLLAEMGSDVHPTLADGLADRRAALDELGNMVTVVIPLQYIDVAGMGDCTVRRYLVGTEQTQPRKGEVGINPSSILSAIGSPGNMAPVEKAHALLSECAEAFDRMRRACLGDADKPFTPGFVAGVEAVAAVQELIQKGRSDLAPWSSDGQPAAEDEAPSGSPEDIAAADAASATPSAAPASVASAPLPAGATEITSHAAARAYLEAAERYFASNEPASAALLLVTQSRLLIGKSLIEAIETLMPSDAGRAVIDFGPDTKFAIPMDKMRALAGEARRSDPAPEAETAAPDITTRGDVAMAIRGVEEFYRRNEPSSPIPVLLFKARDYLEKDFHAIVTALIPKPPSEGSAP